METLQKYPDGTILNVNHIVTSVNSPTRQVKVETRNNEIGVFVNTHWFPWHSFFAVNRLVSVGEIVKEQKEKLYTESDLREAYLAGRHSDWHVDFEEYLENSNK